MAQADACLVSRTTATIFKCIHTGDCPQQLREHCLFKHMLVSHCTYTSSVCVYKPILPEVFQPILPETLTLCCICSASDAVAEVAGGVRENIKLRRGFR